MAILSSLLVCCCCAPWIWKRGTFIPLLAIPLGRVSGRNSASKLQIEMVKVGKKHSRQMVRRQVKFRKEEGNSEFTPVYPLWCLFLLGDSLLLSFVLHGVAQKVCEVCGEPGVVHHLLALLDHLCNKTHVNNSISLMRGWWQIPSMPLNLHFTYTPTHTQNDMPNKIQWMSTGETECAERVAEQGKFEILLPWSPPQGKFLWGNRASEI